MEKWVLITAIISTILSFMASAQAIIEIESVSARGSWQLTNTKSGYSGSGYFQWNGGDYFDSVPQDSVLAYTFSAPSAGDYVVEIHGRRDSEGVCAGQADDQCNDIWLQVNGEWEKKMLGGDWGEWTWDDGYDYGITEVEGELFETGVVKAEFRLDSGENTIRVSGRSKGTKIDTMRITAAPKYSAGDLVSLHFDHAADPDDGLATAAGHVIVDKLGIPHVVASGTAGTNAGRYVSDSEEVMDAVWGSGNWLNAHDDWSGSVNSAASKWVSTLDSGGDIWVAEGGQSDFTADVIRRVRSQTGTDISDRIHVVQHSAWNEKYTATSDLDYVRYSSGEYLHIDDGNNPGADGIDLCQSESDYFRNLAVSHPAYGDGWQVALDYFIANRYESVYDFSDTAELLYILGIQSDQVSGIDDFAGMFLTGSGPSCTNECTSGARECYGTGYRTCANYDSDSCFEWSSITACASGQSCSGGACSSGGSVSPDRSCVPPASAITDSSGAVWSLGIGSPYANIMRNGVRAADGYGSIILLSQNFIYSLGDDDVWYRWTGSSWVAYGTNAPGACQSCIVADSDCDGCVIQEELFLFITKWKSGQVTLPNLMEAIGIWKNGC